MLKFFTVVPGGRCKGCDPSPQSKKLIWDRLFLEKTQNQPVPSQMNCLFANTICYHIQSSYIWGLSDAQDDGQFLCSFSSYAFKN